MKDKTIPEYYGGEDNPYEAIKVINAWGLGFELGNVCKYIARAGKKDKSKRIEDLEKAKRYLELEITKLKDQEQVYILKDTGNIFMQNSDLGTGHLEKAFWTNIKTAVGCGKPDDNKETVALLDQALEKMDKISGEELLNKTSGVTYHCSPDPLTVLETKMGRAEEKIFSEKLEKALRNEVFQKLCKKTKDWAYSKTNEGITIEELVMFFITEFENKHEQTNTRSS